MSKSLRRKAGVLATALAATAVTGAVLAPAASAATYNPGPTMSLTALTGVGFADNDNDQVAANPVYNPANAANHVARFSLHSYDTWLKQVDVRDNTGKVIGSLRTENGAHQTGYVTIPEAYFNKGYTLDFIKAKYISYTPTKMFTVRLENISLNSGNARLHPVGYDTDLTWLKW